MIAGEQHLSFISFVLAAAHGCLAFLCLARSGSLSRACEKFTRNKTAGIILTAIALLWSALLINQMTLGELSRYKSFLYLLTPLSFFLIITYLVELLASRALGGLLMLIPTLMTDSARWHPSPARLVVVTLAYGMIVLGIWLVLSPYKFRIWTSWLLATPARRVSAGAVFGVIALLLVITGVVTR